MCQKAHAVGVDILKFNRFVNLGHGSGKKQYSLSQQDVFYFFEILMKVRGIFPKDSLELRPHGNFGPRSGALGVKLACDNCYCPASVDLVAIDPSNQIYGCPFLMDQQKIIGSLNEKTGEMDICRYGDRSYCRAV